MCVLCYHNPCIRQCPNYAPPKTKHYCSICGEGICENEKYIINDDNEYAHIDCFYGLNDFAEWLGYEVKIMDGGGY